MVKGTFDVERFATLPSLSVAAHELKAPLALIRQLSLVANDDNFSEKHQHQSLEQLTLVAERSLRLVTDLTQVSNSRASLFSLEPVNPAAVCRGVASDLAPIAKLYGHRVLWPSSRTSLLVVANQRLLERVIANFLDNALKYTEPQTPIRVSVRRIGQKARVNVRDFGPRLGLREYRQLLGELERIKTVRTRPDSSGLGIFIAAEFAKMMHGSIGLTRHRDGVTFFVELPLSQQMSLL